MPRLLILCEYPTLLGGERSMLATLPAVHAAGFAVHVAGPTAGPLCEAVARQGTAYVAWETHDSHGIRLPLERLRSSLADVIGQVRPDLIHANSLSASRISGPVVAAGQVPGIGHLRDIVKLAPQAMADTNGHDRLLAVSHATRKFHLAQALDAAKCEVVYNGVDLDQWAPRPSTGYLHAELGGLPRRTRFVAVIGQLGLRKATDVALAAAQQIVGEMPDVHWLIVGERTSGKQESLELESRLHALAGVPRLVGRVHFLGRRNDVAQLLNECELLVHAARQEPLGRVLLEAAASGLPVVATDVGGTREVFPTEQDGAVLVPAGNSLAIAESVLGLLRNEPRRQYLAEAARRRAVAAFDIRDASQRLIAQYRTVLNC